jgi:asparagine synthase (glutamine-hydrolysing)
MCGICGLHSASEDDSLAATVASMNSALEHRGPDHSGQFDTNGCSMAMRRLSIIDLQGGRQPMENEDGSLSVVFNGEIYNFRALRNQLEKSGRHTFKTNSDTEVILHLFEDCGTETPSLLHGMFAFCVYHPGKDTLFLARDRFGEKPLYYAVRDGALAFSSELPSLLRWNRIPRKLNYTALYYFLSFGYVPPPLTFFEGVLQLPAGHFLVWRNRQATVTRYFNPVYTPDATLSDENVAAEALQDALVKAVASQMIADVPLGAFLSGGIDSSTVVAAMQHQSSRPVKTFNVRFECTAYDESAVARAVAAHLKTDHHEFVITNASFDTEDMWRVIRHFGQPFLDSSAIPTYLISRQIRQHATVALSGDGGDEVFAGYRFFTDAMKVDQLARVPRWLLSGGSGVITAMSRMPGFKRHSSLRKARRAFEIARLPEDVRPAHLETLFKPFEANGLMSAQATEKLRLTHDTYTPQVLGAVSSATRLRQLMHYSTAFRLSEDMLAKVDRMSMATSLEVRCPLLSTEVTDLAMRLPDEMFVRDNTRKYLLRQAGRNWLPPVVYSHPKMGFTIPLHTFLNGHYDELCARYLTGRNHPVIRDLFRADAVNDVISRARSFKCSNAENSVHSSSHQLWGLLQLAAWAECYDVSI